MSLSPSQIEDVEKTYWDIFRSTDPKQILGIVGEARRKTAEILRGEPKPEISEGVRKVQWLIDRIEGAGSDSSVVRPALAALVYFIDPWDIIPDAIPGDGLLDDFHVAEMAAELIERSSRAKKAANVRPTSTVGEGAQAPAFELDLRGGPHLAERAKQMGLLDPYRRKALHDIGAIAARGKEVSPKQHSFYLQLVFRLATTGLLREPCVDPGCVFCSALVLLSTRH